MKYEQYIKDKEAFIFELDNVLYPEKDYLLQVYYLFAQFIEYGEQIEAQGIVRFMEDTYQQDGAADIFDKTAARFDLHEKYRSNFDLLLQNARLPLKLLLFAPVLDFLLEIKAAGKYIFLLVDGNPATQLNKIRQIEWNGLEQYLRVYFSEETESKTTIETLEMIVLKHELNKSNILFAGQHKKDHNFRGKEQITFLSIDKLYLP